MEVNIKDKYLLLLGGKYVETLDTLDVVNPYYDGKVLSSVCRATYKEAELAVEKADSSDK